MVMDTQVYEALARVRDFFLQAGAIGEELDKIVQGATKRVEQKDVVVSEQTAYNVNDITWEPKTGEKGAFDFAGNKTNTSNPDFEALIEDLKNNDNKKFIQGKFYWLFTDGNAVGRKLVKRQK